MAIKIGINDSDDKILEKVAWYYPNPMSDYSFIKNHIAFYAAPMDQCLVNGEIVKQGKCLPQSFMIISLIQGKTRMSLTSVKTNGSSTRF